MLRNRISFLTIALAVLLTITMLPFVNMVDAEATTNGLDNLGFESDLEGWNLIEPPADYIGVIAEPDTFQLRKKGALSISPYRGDKMLRLGSPKTLNEKQQRGENTVWQPFVSNGDSIVLSFYLLSWEHRGNDKFIIDIKDNDGSVPGLTIDFNKSLPGVEDGSLPVEIYVDAGKRGEFLNTGWIEAEINGLIESTSYELVYSVVGGSNNAHATWAYFDNVNMPPIAQFEFSPYDPWEGDFIELMDQSFDPDEPDDEIVSWEWNILWNEESATSGSDLRNPFFIPVNEGTYNITLTVTDSNDATGEVTKTITVDNAPPAVNALDVQVLVGENADLFGRFIDPGWKDTHTATWEIDGVSHEASVEENNLAFMGTGIVTDTLETSELQVGTTLNGKLEVLDNSGGVGINAFTVTVIDANVLEHEGSEGNNTTGTATILESDEIHLSYIQSVNDIDIFEIVAADGSTLPVGSEALVTLEGLPNDYDMVILSERPAALEPGGYQMGGYQMGGYQMGGYQMGGYQMGGSADYPLSQVIFAGIEGSASDNIGGTDISLAELGLSLAEITEGSAGICGVVGFSANRGLTEEVLLANVDTSGTRLFVVVVGANGAFSPEPYVLRIETSQPLDMASILTKMLYSAYTPPVTDWVDTGDMIIHDTSDPITLFVTQRERIIGRYGPEEWAALESTFVNLAENTDIAGKIISVPISKYMDWDSDYSSVDEANNVVFEIRSIINEQLAEHDNIQYVVILGNDDIVPFHRDPDITSIGNERQYAMTSFMRPGSPLFYSLLGGYILTDDYLVDELPIMWQGRPSYVPDISVARLVEKPEEMVEAAEAFIDSEGQLTLDTALVTGYDFFNDGAQAVIETLKQAGVQGQDIEKLLSISPSSLPQWNADQLRASFSSQGQLHKLYNLNAHYTHYSAISAEGFLRDITDILTTIQVKDASVINAILFTMGCHAGLNVPDEAAPDDSALGLDINPQLDLPQSMNRAILVGSTGFGYGDDEGIGGTEYLMGLFVDQLLTTPMTVGEALVAAKQSYRTSTSTWTAYDDKSSIQFTLYGLPQYSVAVNEEITPLSALSQESVGDGEVISGQVILRDYDVVNYNLEVVDTDSGDYYTADNDAQSTAFRPIQPRIVVPLIGIPTNPVHGAILLSGDFDDEHDFDPVITRPTNEWELVSEEIQLLPPSFWPAELASVNTLETSDGVIQTLVVTPGQFLGTGINDDEQIIGTQRLYSTLEFQLIRSSSDDFEPPVISGIILSPSETTGNVNVTIEARDDSGINSILILQYDVSTKKLIKVGEFVTSDPSFNEEFTIEITDPEENSLIIQVVDGPGNVATATGKGANLSFIGVEVTSTSPINENSTIVLTATILDFENLTTPVFYTWDFDDGTFAHGRIENSEISEIEVQHTYPDDDPTGTSSDEYSIALKVTDSNGGIGNIITVVTVDNVAPTVDAGTNQTVYCGEVVSLDPALFNDVGILDTHTATIDWGDDTEPDDGVVVESPFGPSGTTEGINGSVSGNHVYTDIGDYTVTVTVTDDDFGVVSDTLLVTVMQRWSDPEGDVTEGLSAGDIISGDAFNTDTTMTIILRISEIEPISDQFQYRVKLVTDSGEYHLKYRDGHVFGLPNLTFEKDDYELRFTFELLSIGLESGDYIQVLMETQGGIPSEGGVGIIDNMPDSGTVDYDLP